MSKTRASAAHWRTIDRITQRLETIGRIAEMIRDHDAMPPGRARRRLERRVRGMMAALEAQRPEGSVPADGARP